MGNSNAPTQASAASAAPAAPAGLPPPPSSKKPKGLFRRFSNWGKRWAGFFGILLAVIAACVNYEQVRVTRETAIRSVRPHMRVASYVEGPGAGKRTGLYLTNLGLGPATLTKLSIEMGGQTYDLMQPHGQEIAVQAMGLNSLCVVIVAPEPGTVLKVNEEGPLLASTAPLCALPLMKALDKTDIKVHFGYTSMWDEKIEDSQSIHLDLDEAIGIVQVMLQSALAAPAAKPAGKAGMPKAKQ